MRAAVPAALAGERLDRAVAILSGAPRTRATSAIDRGEVRVNDVVVTQRSHRLAEGDDLAFEELVSETAVIAADPSVTVEVVHDDDQVIVVDKPAGVVVHPGAGHADGTLVQGLLARFPEIAVVGDPARPGIVHRLDVGTSGLLVVARTPVAYESLVRQLGERTVDREYDALVWGTIDEHEGLIDAPIGRSTRDPMRMAVRTQGRAARTTYEVAQRWTSPVEVSRLRCRLETGRTHQIRVHLTAIGHPVVGDGRYGGHRPGLVLDRPFLHAVHLGFHHPVTDRLMAFDSELPADLVGVLGQLGPPAT
jgi:23S rRNA pseudouridine1911/1915/1917 synthase